MSSLKGNICVFTGSRQGRRADYGDAARQIGRELVERGMDWCTEVEMSVL
jgi:predicted Rossmann-fold nucleotide-binding protein